MLHVDKYIIEDKYPLITTKTPLKRGDLIASIALLTVMCAIGIWLVVAEIVAPIYGIPAVVVGVILTASTMVLAGVLYNVYRTYILIYPDRVIGMSSGNGLIAFSRKEFDIEYSEVESISAGIWNITIKLKNGARHVIFVRVKSGTLVEEINRRMEGK